MAKNSKGCAVVYCSNTYYNVARSEKKISFFPVASHRLHFFDGFKFTARFVRVKNLSGDDRQTVPCVFMAAVVGTETNLFN